MLCSAVVACCDFIVDHLGVMHEIICVCIARLCAGEALVWQYALAALDALLDITADRRTHSEQGRAAMRVGTVPAHRHACTVTRAHV